MLARSTTGHLPRPKRGLKSPTNLAKACTPAEPKFSLNARCSSPFAPRIGDDYDKIGIRWGMSKRFSGPPSKDVKKPSYAIAAVKSTSLVVDAGTPPSALSSLHHQRGERRASMPVVVLSSYLLTSTIKEYHLFTVLRLVYPKSLQLRSSPCVACHRPQASEGYLR